jgi:hypothetical protein
LPAYRHFHAIEIQHLGRGLFAPLPDRGVFGAVRRRGAEEAGATAGALAFAAVSAVIANAMFMQAGRHPSPMFRAAIPVAASAPASPLPRPVEASLRSGGRGARCVRRGKRYTSLCEIFEQYLG